MVPLKHKITSDPRFPGLEIPRVAVDVRFEPSKPMPDHVAPFFDSAIVDTGSGCIVVPHRVHKSNLFKIHRELGHMPYRISSMGTPPVLQRLVEIGLCFLVRRADGSFAYLPEQFVRARAYLLDPEVRPTGKVLIGLEVLLEHFVTHLEKDNSFLSLAVGS
jgi:hypothetical protein